MNLLKLFSHIADYKNPYLRQNVHMQLKMLQIVYGFTFFDQSSWGNQISRRTRWSSGHFSIEGFLCRKRSFSRLRRTSFWFHLYCKILFRAKIKNQTLRWICISFIIILLSNKQGSFYTDVLKVLHYKLFAFLSQIRGRLFLSKFHKGQPTFLVVFF